MSGAFSNSQKLSKRRARQQTIEDVLGRASQFRSLVSPPVVRKTSINSEDGSTDDEGGLPTRKMSRKGKKISMGVTQTMVKSPPLPSSVRRDVVLDSDDEGEAGTVDGLLAPRLLETTNKKSRARILESDNSDDNEEDDSDQDVRPAKRRRQNRRPSISNSSSGDLVLLTPPQKQALPRLARTSPARETARSGPRSARKNGARSARQRHMELLRRRRMGEKVTESDLESPSSYGEERHAALYDKDPDHMALSDFEDEEEEDVPEQKDNAEAVVDEQGSISANGSERDEERERREEKRQMKKEKRNKKKDEKEQNQLAQIVQYHSKYSDDEDDGYGYKYQSAVIDDEGEDGVGDDMAGFIDDSHAGLFGAPDGSNAEDEQTMLRREIPLQFTFQAHKPLKSHFKDAVEWLVHRRINPAGAFTESDDELYKVAWDRLDREVGGLAQSRFISSIWTPEFYGALRARPYMDSFDIRPAGRGGGGASVLPRLERNVCHACGRTNHPASFRVMFSGKAYDSNTLDDVEEEEEEEEEEDDNDHESIDMHGNAIAPTSRQWYVGVVCHSNAETAHDLLHWRRALKDWVEEKLMADRLLDQVEGRKKKMKTRKRRAFAYKVVDDWEANGTVSSLFRDFMKMLEGAQVKSTKTLSRYGR